MSEQMNTQPNGFRKQLLTTVSAVALLASAYGADAADNNTDRPPLWIELGGQWESASSEPDIFSPSFFDLVASPANLNPLIDAQRPSRNSVGVEGKISFMPEDTNWVLSAAVRYGRSNTARHLHHQTPEGDYGKLYAGTLVLTSHFIPAHQAFGDGQTKLGSSHLVADFQAGKDVGLGLFGNGGTSVVSAGVRFAQFSSTSDVKLYARPVYKINMVTSPGKYRLFDEARATYTGVFRARRSVHAIGPTLSWEASQPVSGNGADTTFNFDWGVNAAILFGRQHASMHHQVTGHYYTGLLGQNLAHHYDNPPVDTVRARTATIPNVGGFAGVSLKFPNAKVALGYRADFFFGAMDGGIDTARRENIGFYGPFATISVGVGG